MINKSPEVTNKSPKVINKSPKMINKSPKVINKSPQLNEDIFKKPSHKKQFPKPEKLAYWYDYQHNFGMYNCSYLINRQLINEI